MISNKWCPFDYYLCIAKHVFSLHEKKILLKDTTYFVSSADYPDNRPSSQENIFVFYKPQDISACD